MREVFSQVADNLIHEGDLFAIVSTGPSSIRVDMTYDRSRLAQTTDLITGDGFSPNELIQTVAPGSRGPAELNWRAHTAFKTAQEIIKALEDIPNRRKSFIYFSNTIILRIITLYVIFWFSFSISNEIKLD